MVRKSGTVKHTIRSNLGNPIEVTLTRSLAVKVFCTECLGYGEENPKNCSSLLCPLWPFRGKKLLAYENKPAGEVEDTDEEEDENV